MTVLSLDEWTELIGEEVETDLCPCSSWTVGNKTCKCGNTPLYLNEVDDETAALAIGEM